MTLKIESVNFYGKEKLSKFETKFIASLMRYGPCFLLHQVAVSVWTQVRIIKRILSTIVMICCELSNLMRAIWIVICELIVFNFFLNMTTRCPCIRRCMLIHQVC